MSCIKTAVDMQFCSYAILLGVRQMPGLQVQQRALVASEGAVAALVGISQPGASRVIAVLV